MHVSTSAIFVILLSFLGASKTAHAEPYEDAFGLTNFGIKCQDRVYPKHAIYAAAKNYCDINKKIPRFSDQHSINLGFQTRFYYYFSSKTDINKLLKGIHLIVPILEDGSLYPLGSRKKLAGNKKADKTDKRDPGPDRLVIDLNCDIMGAFTDFSYTPEEIENKVEECRILDRSNDRFFSPIVRSPERSPYQSPPRSRDHSPERSLHQSPARSRDQSFERLPESSSERSNYQSLE